MDMRSVSRLWDLGYDSVYLLPPALPIRTMGVKDPRITRSLQDLKKSPKIQQARPSKSLIHDRQEGNSASLIFLRDNESSVTGHGVSHAFEMLYIFISLESIFIHNLQDATNDSKKYRVLWHPLTTGAAISARKLLLPSLLEPSSNTRHPRGMHPCSI